MASRTVVLAPRPEVVAWRDAHRHKRGYDGEWTVEQLDRILRDETPLPGAAELVEELLARGAPFLFLSNI